MEFGYLFTIKTRELQSRTVKNSYNKVYKKMKKLIKKIIPYTLLLIVLVGIFGVPYQAKAAETDPGKCTTTDKTDRKIVPNDAKTRGECTALNTSAIRAEFKPDDGSGTITPGLPCTGTTATKPPTNTPIGCDPTAKPPDTPPESSTNSAFEKTLTHDCGVTSGAKVMGCVLVVLYYTYFQIPAFILMLSAGFFNSMVSISLDSTLTSSSKFIPEAWVVIRDLSNIFFILVLLYISIQTILGIGGHDGPKKMIAQVILMALLINFSMFFTKIVIDSANILALVFFEKVNVESKVAGESKPRDYDPSRPGEKDISGGIAQAFNPTKLVDKPFLDKTKIQKTFAGTVVSETVPFSIKLGMIVVSGTIMLFAAYTFFIAGISFLGRLIELWILIIFSPFAFMSSIIPILSHIEGIGWESWLKKLLSTSFMAPIFMFFIYLIFKLIKTNIFESFVSGEGFMANFLGILLPALILLALLLKATEFAKKGGGKFGEMALGAVKMAGGLALGAATGGAALLGTGLIGGAANSFMSSGLGAKLRNREKEGGIGGFASRMALRTANYGTKASFDVRKVAGVGALAKMGGVNLEAAKGIGLGTREGGYMQRRADKEKKRQERANELKVREDDPLKQASNAVEASHQDLLAKDGNAHHIELLDNRIKTLGDRSSTASRDSKLASSRAKGEEGGAINSATGNTFAKDADLAKNALSDAQGERTAIKNASMFRQSNGKIIDHRGATTDTNLSEDALKGIENAQRSSKYAADQAIIDALHAFALNPADPEIPALNAARDEAINGLAITTAARDTAYAARDVTLIDNLASAATAAAANPADAKLAAAVEAATEAVNAVNANVAATTATANASAANLSHMAAANQHNANLNTAAVSATSALRKIEKGLSGRSINNLEDTDMPHAHAAVEKEDKSRQRAEAGRLARKTFWGNVNKAAAHKITMNAKLDSGTGGKGGGGHS